MFLEASCSFTAGIISRTGKSMLNGLKGKGIKICSVDDYVNRRGLNRANIGNSFGFVLLLPLTPSKGGLAADATYKKTHLIAFFYNLKEYLFCTGCERPPLEGVRGRTSG